MTYRPEVCIVGGGMITRVQILPSFLQLQRLGLVGDIHVCARQSATLRELASDAMLRKAFPGFRFIPHPSLVSDSSRPDSELYRKVVSRLPPRRIVVVAVPDHLHYDVIKTALECNQHVCSVKPLVLKYRQAEEIATEARRRGLVVAVEYHKRFDDRSLIARRLYRAGRFGEFRIGQASLMECWYYRHSNFQNWCTCGNSDMFAYIACHYIDLVHFITGLKPVSVSVYGIRDRYPNGQEGFLWTDGRVIWENGACLNVQNSLGYPDEGPGGNFQGMRLYGSRGDRATLIVHNDQFRGVEHCYLERGTEPGDTVYAQPNPDYFQYVDAGGGGLTPVGYGYRSIAAIVGRIRECMEIAGGRPERKALRLRQEYLDRLDTEDIIATPRNSSYNELVMEAGRLSILNGGREALIRYGARPGVGFRKF